MKTGVSTSSSSSSSSSASRLSPLARPFTLNRTPSASFNPSLDNLESASTLAAYAYHYTHHSDADADAAAAFPYDDFQSFSHYPSHKFQDNAHFPSLSHSDFVNKSSQSQNFSTFKDKNATGDSMAATSFVKQGKPAAERLKHFGEASYNLHGKCNRIMGNGNQIRAEDTEQIDAECHSLLWENSGASSFKFSTSSDLCSISKLQDPPSRPSYPAPVNIYDSKIAPKERCFSQLDSYTAKSPTVSQSSEYNSSVLVSRPSGTGTTLFNPVLSENVDSSGNDAPMKPRLLLNAKDKVVCLDKILTDKGKERKDDEPSTIGAMDSLVKANSELQITLKPHGVEAGVLAVSSSVLSDHSDSDLDSPCWKGTQVYQATTGVSDPVSAQLIKNEAEASNSLNPLAPQFYPGSAKLNVNCHETECDRNDLSSFQKIAFSDVALSAREHRLIDSVKSGTCPSGVSNATGTQCSKHIHEPEMGAAHGSNRSSLLSSCSIQPYLVEDYHTSKCQLATGSKNAGSLIGKNAALNGSTSLSSLVTKNVMKSSSSRVGVSSEFTKTVYGASKSTPPRADVHLVVNTMHDLSELLMQNCSNALDSLNEHEHEIIEHIINNLLMCIGNKGRQRAPIPESSNLRTSYNLRKSADCQKQSNMEFQVTRMKTMTIPHGQERQKRCPTMSCEKVLESFCPNSGEVIERGNGIPQMQVIEESLKENLDQIEGEMHTHALLYRNLWLEAEAALCYMKYKAGQLQIRQKIRVDDSSLVGRDGGEGTSRVCLRLSEAHKFW